MKTILISLLLTGASMAATGDYQFTKKAAVGYTPFLLTPVSGRMLIWDGAGDLSNLTPGTGLATWMQTPSSANLAATLTDETGAGAAVFASSPTLVTPTVAAINGGTAANDDLTLQGTTNATRSSSYVVMQPSGGFVGIGTATPAQALHVRGAGARLRIENTTADPVLELTSGSGTSYLFTQSSNWYMRTDNTAKHVFLQAGSASGNVQVGGVAPPAPASQLVVRGTINTTAHGLFDLRDFAGTSVMSVISSGSVALGKTVTTAGTTGAQTIHKASGSVNFAAAATSLVVTNNLCTTASIIVATIATADATAGNLRVVAGSGSFTIYMTAPTAETRVNFLLTN